MEILPQLLVNSLITGSMYALAAAGLALSYSLLRVLNFAHGHFMMVGAYLVLWASSNEGFSALTATSLVLLGLLALAAFTLSVFIRPFLKRNALLPFVTTLALATMLEAIVSMLFGVNVRSFALSSAVTSLQIGPVFITPVQLGIVIGSVGLLTLLALVVHLTGVGRRIRALAESPEAAATLGINLRAVQFWGFFLSTILAALAGVMVGIETNLQPTMGGVYTIKTFAAMTLGGLGSVWGTVVGSYTLGLFENLVMGLDLGGYSIPSGYKDAFSFVVILLVLLVRPQGLFSSSRREV